MSLTVISFAIAAPCFIIALVLGFATDKYGWRAGFPALAFFAVGSVALIIAIGSYNQNVGAASDREKAACVEEGNEVLRYNSVDYCVEPGSKIIRVI